MEIDVSFTAEERATLERLLARQDQARVDDIAKLIAQAGAKELLAQATGRAVFSSISDLRMFRVLCLIEAGVGLPEAERLVAVIFKVPPGTAKRVVGNAIARYGADLSRSVRTAIAQALDAACYDTLLARWNVDLTTAFMRDTVLDILAGLAPPQPDPTPAQRGSRWRFPEETYAALRQELALQPKAQVAC